MTTTTEVEKLRREKARLERKLAIRTRQAAEFLQRLRHYRDQLGPVKKKLSVALAQLKKQESEAG